MRIFTVTCDGRAAAIVRAASGDEAIGLVLELAPAAEPQRFSVREPSDAEMIDWLQNPTDHFISKEPLAA